jgi:hypothetical protein
MKMRRGKVGSIARWVAKCYLELISSYPEMDEKEIRFRIAEKRFPNGEFDVSGESSTGNIMMTNRILICDDLADLSITFYRYESGDLNPTKDKLGLILAVTFEELIECGIPSRIAVRNQ